MDFPGGSNGKESAWNAGDPGLGRSPGEGHDNPTAVFLPSESHGQRSLEGYGPQGHTELDTTGVTLHTCTQKDETSELIKTVTYKEREGTEWRGQEQKQDKCTI